VTGSAASSSIVASRSSASAYTNTTFPSTNI
jgi:hypothetical protein